MHEQDINVLTEATLQRFISAPLARAHAVQVHVPLAIT